VSLPVFWLLSFEAGEATVDSAAQQFRLWLILLQKSVKGFREQWCIF
jgi:hypothetical protein